MFHFHELFPLFQAPQLGLGKIWGNLRMAREARRSTVFERPVDAGTSEPVVGTGPVFVSDGVDKKPLRRRRTTLLEEEDGTMRPMSNLDLTASFLDGAAKSMPGNKAVDVERLKERGNLIAKGQKLFEDLALEAGVSLGTRACLDPVLSVADMSEAVGKLVANKIPLRSIISERIFGSSETIARRGA